MFDLIVKFLTFRGASNIPIQQDVNIAFQASIHLWSNCYLHVSVFNLREMYKLYVFLSTCIGCVFTFTFPHPVCYRCRYRLQHIGMWVYDCFVNLIKISGHAICPYRVNQPTCLFYADNRCYLPPAAGVTHPFKWNHVHGINQSHTMYNIIDFLTL